METWMRKCLVFAVLFSLAVTETVLLGHKDKFYCIASGNSESSFISSVATSSKAGFTIYSEWKSPESLKNPRNDLDQILTCDLHKTNCTAWNKEKNLKKVSNWEIETNKNFGQVLDFRWQYQNGNSSYSKIFSTTISLPSQVQNVDQYSLPLHMSIFATNNVNLALSRGKDPHSSASYWITIDDGSLQHRNMLRKCPQGIPRDGNPTGECAQIKKQRDFQIYFLKRFYHFTLEIVKEVSSTTLIVRHREDVVFSWTDTSAIEVNFLSFRTDDQNLGVIRYHKHYVLQAKLVNTEVLGPEIEVNTTQPLCISLIYFSDVGLGQMRLVGGTRVASSEVPLEAGPRWQVSRLEATMMKDTKYHVSISTPKEHNSTFVIGDIRVCRQKETYVKTLSNALGDSVKCNVLKSDETIGLKPLLNTPAFDCLGNKFGTFCNMTCETFLKDQANCAGVTACSAMTCSCLAGYTGANCTETCPAKKFGPNCLRDCSPNCLDAGVCAPETGTCFSGCKNGWMSARCDTWQTKLWEAPRLLEALSDSLVMTVAEDNNSGGRFHVTHLSLQYKESSATAWNTVMAVPWPLNGTKLTVNGLESNTTYLVRAVLLNVEGGGYMGEDVPTVTATTSAEENLVSAAFSLNYLHFAILGLLLLLSLCGVALVVFAVRCRCKTRDNRDLHELQEIPSGYNNPKMGNPGNSNFQPEGEEDIYEEVGAIHQQRIYENF